MSLLFYTHLHLMHFYTVVLLFHTPHCKINLTTFLSYGIRDNSYDSCRMVRFRIDIKRQLVRFDQIKGSKVTSKKPVSKRLLLIVIDSLLFLNKALMLFIFLSSAGALFASLQFYIFSPN